MTRAQQPHQKQAKPLNSDHDDCFETLCARVTGSWIQQLDHRVCVFLLMFAETFDIGWALPATPASAMTYVGKEQRVVQFWASIPPPIASHCVSFLNSINPLISVMITLSVPNWGEKLSNGASIPKKWRHVLATKELHGWFASAKGITTGSGYQQLQDLNTFSQCQTYQVAPEWGWSRNVCWLNTGCQVLCFYYPQWQQPRCDRYHWVYCKAYQSCKQTALRAEIS